MLLIQDIFKQMAMGTSMEEFLPPAPVVRTPKVHEYFVHFNPLTREIASVSTNPNAAEGLLALNVGKEQGVKFLSGTDSIFRYLVIDRDDKFYELVLADSIVKVAPNRIDVVEMTYQVQKIDNFNALFRFKVLEDDNIVEVYYDGEKIKAVESARFYFTRFDDPSYLKCAFTLDVNILDDIIKENGWQEWPNPVRLKVENANDLSIYGIKSQPPAILI